MKADRRDYRDEVSFLNAKKDISLAEKFAASLSPDRLKIFVETAKVNELDWTLFWSTRPTEEFETLCFRACQERETS